MPDQPDRMPTAFTPDHEYIPAGEAQGVGQSFTAGDIAHAFGVEDQRVAAALRGEFDLGTEATVDSRQAQQLAEVLLSDQPLAERQAALMRLGAFTPRSDHEFGFGEKPDDTESDRLVRRGDQGDEERG